MELLKESFEKASSQTEQDDALSSLWNHLINFQVTQSELLEYKDILTIVLRIICENGKNELTNDVPFEIIKRASVLGPDQIMEHLCTHFLTHIKNEHGLCSGLTEVFVHLTKRDPFRIIFAKKVGVWGLEESFMSVVKQLSAKKEILPLTPFDEGTFDPLPDSARDWLSSSRDTMLTSRTENVLVSSRNQLNSSKDSSEGKSKGMVPKLPLPLKPESPMPSSRFTRRLSVSSSPFEMNHRASFGSRRGSFRLGDLRNCEEGAKQKLQMLASGLGETYMAADLSHLLPYLNSQSQKNQLGQSFEFGMSSLKNEKKIDLNVQILENILNIWANITATGELIQLVTSPVDVLFLALKESFSIEAKDQTWWPLIFKVLSNYANYVEYVYRKEWSSATIDFPLEKKKMLLRQMDEFVWIAYKQCITLLEKPRTESQLITQCRLLAEYMQFCPTRVMATQVSENFLKVLVKIKLRLFRTEIKRGSLAAVPGVDALVCVLSQLILQSRFSQLNNLLFKIILDDEDTWLFLRNYAMILFADDEIEKNCLRTPYGREQLNIYRQHIMRFYCYCITLLNRLEAEHSAVFTAESGLSENLYKFQFLVDPISGICLRFLRKEKDNDSGLPVEQEVTEFLNLIFSCEKSPWRVMKECVDTYISFHYLTFIKNYHNQKFTRKMFETCKIHLKVLLCFALKQNGQTRGKFSQLRIVDFLTSEFSLEYEEKRIFERLSEAHEPSGKHSPTSAPPKPISKKAIPKLALGPLLMKGAVGRERSASNPASPSFDVNGCPMSDPISRKKGRPEIPRLKLSQPPPSKNPLQVPLEGLGPQKINDPNRFYEESRKHRMLYFDDDIHVKLLILLFSLIVHPSDDCLEDLYCDELPLLNNKLNIPFILFQHLNHPQNKYIAAPLIHQINELNKRTLFIVFKLLTTRSFHQCFGEGATRIGQGAYGSVWKSSISVKNITLISECAIKLMPLPENISDRCAFYQIFTEILIMDRFRDVKISKLYDFGVDNENYWIVMKYYKSSLRDWRLKQRKSLEENLFLYLNVFALVLETAHFLVEKQVNHYDIKCDNFLILPNSSNTDIFNQTSDRPNFSVVLTDFGTAKAWKDIKDSFTVRNRGTECIKSPEMMLIARESSQAKEKDSDRRKMNFGANSASDVWSLGCLFYELLTGDWLFNFGEGGDAQLFSVVTCDDDQKIPILNNDAKNALGHNPYLIEFLEYVLVRKYQKRPEFDSMCQKFHTIRQKLSEANKRVGKSESFANLSELKRLERSVSMMPQKQMHSAATVTKKADLPDLTPTELSFFELHPMKLTEKIFLAGSLSEFSADYLMMQYQITHFLLCKPAENPWPMQFEHFSIDLEVKSSKKIQDDLMAAVRWMKAKTENENGRVMIIQEPNSSQGIAVGMAYMLENKKKSLHEAWIEMNHLRYNIPISQNLLEELCDFQRNIQ